MELYDLKTLHMKQAFGIDQTPYFSWKLKSTQKNVVQEAYEIIVSTDGKTIWNSGKVSSKATAFIDYQGEALKSRQAYTWTVTSWTNTGECAVASAGFEMALTDSSLWQAKWVSSTMPRTAVTQYKYGDTFAPVLFTRDFEISKKVSKARLYATAYGAYQLSMNGIRPDDREFAPEFTVYDKILYYQTYDVTRLLAQGTNRLSMYVGDGWYFSGQAGPVERKVEKPSILYQLEITYEDNTT